MRSPVLLFSTHLIPSCSLNPDAVQYLGNILNDFPDLLAAYASILPTHNTFRLSDDFADTRVILLLADTKVVHTRASFGLIDVNNVEGDYFAADVHIFALLRSALLHKEHEEALLTLRGGDARRCMIVIQTVRTPFSSPLHCV